MRYSINSPLQGALGQSRGGDSFSESIAGLGGGHLVKHARYVKQLPFGLGALERAMSWRPPAAPGSGPLVACAPVRCWAAQLQCMLYVTM